MKRWLPTVLVGIFAVSLLRSLRVPEARPPFDLNGFGKLPVLQGGRVKPLDTIARASLLMVSGKQALQVEDRSTRASEWLMDVMFRPSRADAYPVFEIDNPDVLGLMGMEQTTNRRYSFLTLQPHLGEIESQATRADAIKPERRSPYQTAILNLQGRITLYQKLQNTLDLERYQFLAQVAEFYPLPLPETGASPTPWVSMGEGILRQMLRGQLHPGVAAYAAMGDAYRESEPSAFNRVLNDYRRWLNTHVPRDTSLAGYEWLFNAVEPFFQSLVMYTVVFVIVCLSWMFWPVSLTRAAFALLILAFAVHTVGLISRMVLQGRPPVTNLYSSAIFVGWAAVLLGIILEGLFRRGIGSAVASAIGFLTLIIAHHLAAQGDTLEMMRAVLDSNFWLATHVVCITIGYSSTFLAGFIAVVYVLRRRFDRLWDEKSAATLEQMVYGVVCFSTFFSFLGTILGGIWADQSWGRFWGWDPKENGALMIVLWNVLILHARWSGFTQPRTIMTMAVFGNVVTALSWFGVNMLGIGLHSYGFMDKAFLWLMVFVASQLAVMGVGVYTGRGR